MKSPFGLALSALVLSCTPSFAQADEAPQTQTSQVERQVQEGLLKPLVEQEKKISPFSRMAPPPHERRLRVTQTAATLDKNGRPYVTFAVDARYTGAEWQENAIVGCDYPQTGDLFVKIGNEYRPASFLLGKNADPVAGVCQPKS